MKILYIYPIPGELGWLLFNSLPNIHYVMQEKGPFDKVMAHVRRNYEDLYRFADITKAFDYHNDCTEGNAFVLHRPDAYNTYKAHCGKCDEAVKKLEGDGHKVKEFRLPKKHYRYHRYKVRHKLFLPMEAATENLARWASQIRPDAVVFHLRHISRSVKKNTPKHLYQEAHRWAEKHGRQFVTVGSTLGFGLKFGMLGLDLMNKTSLRDLISIYHLCGLVVGSSSGPMHLASLTGTPHVVWGGGRKDIRDRYIKHWNPFDVPVDHLTTAFSFKDKALLKKAVEKMAKHPAARADQRNGRVVAQASVG
jgi:hypothetical protein